MTPEDYSPSFRHNMKMCYRAAAPRHFSPRDAHPRRVTKMVYLMHDAITPAHSRILASPTEQRFLAYIRARLSRHTARDFSIVSRPTLSAWYEIEDSRTHRHAGGFLICRRVLRNRARTRRIISRVHKMPS